ncbi:HNHc domain containing protein [uncultured Caudovirales phage]|uniref:HNHc domain containing protein n=1 Tax=uncultured Caudovirales phage TaxID=2100421 RepID=A0A6J5M620_9CAUD|nr:HNHc domain containing protein [uncultured Caudovirales phage]
MSALKDTGSTTKWRKIRQRILWRDQNCCYWCGGEANTVDHLIERSAGGTDDEQNLVAACAKCNYGRVGAKAAKGGFFNSTGTPLTLPVAFTPQNGSISHD